MRRRRGTVEVIGLSFLDMISCAFGGVIVLYLITPSVDSAAEPFSVTRVVELRTANGAPLVVGMRFPAASGALGCFELECPNQPEVREWSRGQGRLTALLAESTTPPLSLEIAILGGDGFFTTDCFVVRAEIDGQQRRLKLTRSSGFRRRIDPFVDPASADDSCP